MDSNRKRKSTKRDDSKVARERQEEVLDDALKTHSRRPIRFQLSSPST